MTWLQVQSYKGCLNPLSFLMDVLSVFKQYSCFKNPKTNPRLPLYVHKFWSYIWYIYTMYMHQFHPWESQPCLTVSSVRSNCMETIEHIEIPAPWLDSFTILAVTPFLAFSGMCKGSTTCSARVRSFGSTSAFVTLDQSWGRGPCCSLGQYIAPIPIWMFLLKICGSSFWIASSAAALPSDHCVSCLLMMWHYIES